MTSDDRRLGPRRWTQVTAMISHNRLGMARCKLRDISLEGAFVVTGKRILEPDDSVELVLKVRTGKHSQHCRVPAKVARVSDEGAALVFDEPDEELYRTATELLERALARDGRAVRLIGLGVSQLTDDVVQLGLFERRQLSGEALLRSIDRLRAKYGYRCLQTGLTFFDPYVSSPDWEPERHTGLSSQVGRDATPT